VSGPTKEEQGAPSELWTKFTQLPRPVSPRHKFHARGRDVADLVFHVLTAGELSWIRQQANLEVKNLLGADARVGNIAYEEEWQQQIAYHIVQQAARVPERPIFPVFNSPKDVARNLTDDEIAVLMHAYESFRRESGPYISDMTVEEMEAWIKLLMEGGSRLPLARLSGPALTDLVLSLALRLKQATSIATSSSGSPLDDSRTPASDGPPSPDAPPADPAIGT
jgi:hypothetical protein